MILGRAWGEGRTWLGVRDDPEYNLREAHVVLQDSGTDRHVSGG